MLARVDTGTGQILASNAGKLAVGDRTMVFVRPERLKVTTAPDCPNRIAARITHFDFEGNFANVFLRGAEGQPLMLQAANDGGLPGLKPGADMMLTFAPEHAVALVPGELAKE